MAEWTKETLGLGIDHTWRAPDGYNIFVADKGAVRLNYPHGWIVKPDSDSIKFYDREPPDDDCRLAVSYIRLPPIDWSDLPLSRLVDAAIQGDSRGITHRSDFIDVVRPGLEICWVELTFFDKTLKRTAHSRLCIGRGSNIQSLLTFEFWPEDREKFDPAWNEVIRSLDLGLHIEDPTKGEVIH
jgi:hypothetical protein